MELPTTRELELETLLRQRDAQVTQLTDELLRLRQYLSTQPSSSTTDPVTLPPSLTSLLLPHLNNLSLDRNNNTASSSSVTTALTQRARLLQEENDELYELLKQGETGKLKEVVRGLRRVVERVEGALRESHKVVASLTSELDKSYETFMATARQTESRQSPQASYHSSPHKTNGTSGSGSKFLPTGPRGQKKRRLSDSPISPQIRQNMPLPSRSSRPNINNSGRSNHSESRSPRANHAHAHGHRGNGNTNHTARMNIDDDRSDGDRGRERYHQSRPRDAPPRWDNRDRGHARANARNVGRSRSPERTSTSSQSGVDRTLAERMRL